MSSDSHINQLLEAVSTRSCEKSYKELFIIMNEKLVNFAFAILKSSEDAEEVVSDFFINLWVKRSSLRSVEKPKLYLFIGVKNYALNKLKANKRSQIPQLDEWATRLDSVFFNPEEMAISAEMIKRIMAAVNQLPPKCRVIFRLIKEDGLKYAEVAQLLDISVKTVESQMAIALRRIRSCLEFKNEFPEIHSLLTRKK
ncbi:MAG: RNA polymerase sigma-70 factor [Sphingobacteriia bacterium]|nr:RNA polymerase sigma-70 factor [Sphingobacteriia bacterium]